MSQNLHSLSPLLSSPYQYSKPMIHTKTSSVVKNLEQFFDQQQIVPIIERSKHPDLQRISSETVRPSLFIHFEFVFFVLFQLITLLSNPSNDLLIIDARYPFEYTGGHIKSAENIYTDSDLRLLFTKLISSSTRPSMIVFHCEFSSERGPRLCRLFRSLDRQYNLSNYPYLSFPSIYLLDGGYAEFYQHSCAGNFCQPNAYISMFEQQYKQELQIYRHGKKVSNGKVLNRKLIEHQGPIQFCMS